jgi:hypothetical protein
VKKLFIFIVFSVIVLFSCTEPFTIQDTEVPDEVLVIEASITNENKFQKIFLSKAYKLSSEEEATETNATVHIEDENNTIYLFNETTPGTYVSSSKFSAQSGVNYQLFITRATGEKYESKPEKTNNSSEIEDITVKLSKDILGDNEFRFYVSSHDATGKSQYYRYTYEETYLIKVPFWSSSKAVPTGPSTAEIVPKTDAELKKRFCYNSNKSTGIIQTETSNLSEDRVLFSVKSISTKDFSVSHRYSLLVKQHVQSYEAYHYYKKLSKFSNASSLLSQIQPGFFNGNIHSTSNKSSKVIGFFEVTSVSEKRVFFNYRDFFIKGRPKYIQLCGPYAFNDQPGLTGSEMINALNDGYLYIYTNFNRDEDNPGPYFLVPQGCGDCTVHGSNIKPDFWVD